MLDEELVDEELAELIERKRRILAKAISLRNEFIDWEKSSGKKEKDFSFAEDQFQHIIDENIPPPRRINPKSVALTNYMIGTKFSRVDRKWVSDHKYLYTANIKTKVLELVLEVTVNRKDAAEGNQILKINCNFIDLRRCFFLEISSWVQQFTEANDTFNLFSAISDYSEHNVTRSKYLKQLQTDKIAYAQECNDNEGGVRIFLHAKEEPDFVYFEIEWVLKFVDSLWQIDNAFTIHPISATDDFLEANNELLQSFCKCRMKEKDLEILWNKLCSAIEADEPSQSTTGTDQS